MSQRIESAWLNYQQMIARGQEVAEVIKLNEDFKVVEDMKIASYYSINKRY